MIIVKLTGGAGNQMFQYAAGRALAEKHKTGLKLDISEFSDNKQNFRDYQLDRFNIRGSIASRQEIEFYKYGKRNFLNKSLLARAASGNGFSKRIADLLFIKKSYIKEKDFNFSTKLLNSSDNVYLDGWWQSEKYFKDIHDVINQEFTLKDSPDKTNASLLEKISAMNSVSLHFRRGDYATDPNNLKKLGICGREYYSRCIDFVKDKISNPCFFIFSDDIELAKSELDISCQHFFIDNNKNNSLEDLRLMSSCKTNILANSSFSWWSAWLNPNPDKLVLAPDPWFIRLNTEDLIPETWTKIKN